MSNFRCVYVPSVGACEGFIYVSTHPSRCGHYCGFNASLGNASYSVM